MSQPSLHFPQLPPLNCAFQGTGQFFKTLSQSKKSDVDGTTTLDSVFREMQKDLGKHGYVAAKLVTSVPGKVLHCSLTLSGRLDLYDWLAFQEAMAHKLADCMWSSFSVSEFAAS